MLLLGLTFVCEILELPALYRVLIPTFFRFLSLVYYNPVLLLWNFSVQNPYVLPPFGFIFNPRCLTWLIAIICRL
ncbi:unnamed protein product [Amaranthus hypochondriacus]